MQQCLCFYWKKTSHRIQTRDRNTKWNKKTEISNWTTNCSLQHSVNAKRLLVKVLRDIVKMVTSTLTLINESAIVMVWQVSEEQRNCLFCPYEKDWWHPTQFHQKMRLLALSIKNKHVKALPHLPFCLSWETKFASFSHFQPCWFQITFHPLHNSSILVLSDYAHLMKMEVEEENWKL